MGIYSPPTKTSRCGEDSVQTGKTGQTAHYKTGQTAQAPTAINLAVGLASGPTASINSGPTGAIGQTARGPVRLLGKTEMQHRITPLLEKANRDLIRNNRSTGPTAQHIAGPTAATGLTDYRSGQTARSHQD